MSKGYSDEQVLNIEANGHKRFDEVLKCDTFALPIHGSTNEDISEDEIEGITEVKLTSRLEGAGGSGEAASSATSPSGADKGEKGARRSLKRTASGVSDGNNKEKE